MEFNTPSEGASTSDLGLDPMPTQTVAASDEAPERTPIFGTFFIGDGEFAISVESIQEVVNEPAQFTEIPLSPDYLLGLFNLRGVVIPVVDIRVIFGFSTDDSASGERKVAIIEHGEHCFGLLVDRTGDVFNAKDAEQSLFNRTEGDLRETIVRGVFKLDQGSRLVQILDPFELLNLEKLPRVDGALRSSLSRRKRGKRYQCISFKVGDMICAFDMTSIKEIVELRGIDNASLARDWTLGAIDLRGNTVPVIDFRQFLGNTCTQTIDELVESGAKLIVMRMNGSLISLLVDAIDNIVSYYADDLLPFPKIGLHHDEMFKGCLHSDDDTMVLLLDHQSLFDDDQLSAVVQGHSTLFQESDETARENERSKRNKRTLITFQVASSYALDIEDVNEVIGFPSSIVRPPSVPDAIEGMVNLRGELIPIINLRQMYDLPAIEREGAKLMIFALEDKKYAIMVDAVDSICTISDSDAGSLPRLASGDGSRGISDDVKEAIVLKGETTENGALMLLDLASVVRRAHAAMPAI
ncbi:MAG: chemotaxis protein CheW [Henriciella sp.]|nr:chemotaxis protein CheW [Henriciella sp.]